ncbi:hydroxymethylbilane synthase [Luteibacter aegosomaticola]|jgi:hydroxymethylbilane synthase|uniref:hydroxymethylbilane synthase n=1 Tax=Luteibacter aegosomaticola TaxID=2911538 RepID=UPI001FF9FBD7|nr:hydroxymethylbilane synthase [Luteibacter aegosomaticola]UPG90113.1 hydroxymethylbilane synthase [Luteibacter aegosomaticola]
MPAPLRIATRKSALALWQAEHVAALLRQAHPGLVVELVPLSTRGDEVLDRSLATIGGKGLFLKELEVAMEEGRADIAVHSLKDVPAVLEPGFALSAILPRADAADGFISNAYSTIAELPNGARVGTSSLRRQAQLRALRPDLQLLDLRGNINTRIAKLDEGHYDAIVLACAGVDRLGMGGRVRTRLASPDWLPAPGQGAIAVEIRDGDTHVAELLAAIDDADTRLAIDAERALNEQLGGSCAVAIGAMCVVAEFGLTLHGLVGNAHTGELIRAQADLTSDNPVELGHTVAAMLLEQGADEFLKPQR